MDIKKTLPSFIAITVDASKLRTILKIEPNSAVLRNKKKISFILFLAIQNCKRVQELFVIAKNQKKTMELIKFVQNMIVSLVVL